MLEYEVKRMVNRDIEYCKQQWENHSFDWEVMGELFWQMMNRYINIIDGFEKDMKIISAYEKKNDSGDTYRHNVQIIIKRLEAFRDNGFKNEGLNREFNKDFKIWRYEMDEFNDVRRVLDENEVLDSDEKEEISLKLDEIEAICASDENPTDKWEKLRPYVVWLSGKNLVVASQIFSVIMNMGRDMEQL